MTFDEIKKDDSREYLEEPIERDRYKIYFGSSEYMPEIPDNSVHLVVTSPPYYSMRGTMGYDNYNHFLKVMYKIFKNLYDKLKPGRPMMINISDYQVATDLDKSNPEVLNSDIGKKFDIPSHFSYILYKLNEEYATRHPLNYEDTITWTKPGSTSQRAGTFIQSGFPLKFRPNQVNERILVFRKGELDYDRVWKEARRSGRYPDRDISTKEKFEDEFSIEYESVRDYLTDLWRIPPETNSDHPAPFPVELPEACMELYSLPEEIVLEPFFGFGTTALAAQNLNRKCVGYENFDAEAEDGADFVQNIRNRLAADNTGLSDFM